MKVNTKNIPEEYKSLVKEEMTYNDISVLGSVIIKTKIENFKMKVKNAFRRKKNDKKCKKEI